MPDVDDLPPTQYLCLEVLAARHRCGETWWTFPTTVAAALRALEEAGLVATMHGVVEKTVRARLTTAGEDACLSPTFNTPLPTLAQALDTLPKTDDEYRAWMREHGVGHGAGVGTVISCVRQDLERLAKGGTNA